MMSCAACNHFNEDCDACMQCHYEGCAEHEVWERQCQGCYEAFLWQSEQDEPDVYSVSGTETEAETDDEDSNTMDDLTEQVMQCEVSLAPVWNKRLQELRDVVNAQPMHAQLYYDMWCLDVVEASAWLTQEEQTTLTESARDICSFALEHGAFALEHGTFALEQSTTTQATTSANQGACCYAGV